MNKTPTRDSNRSRPAQAKRPLLAHWRQQRLTRARQRQNARLLQSRNRSRATADGDIATYLPQRLPILREKITILRAFLAHGAGRGRLLELVEKDLMGAEDASLRERMVALRFRRDELAQEVADFVRRLESTEPVITPDKVDG
jgi:hypothetical protein